MEIADILTIIGGIGGMQGFIELIKWWRGRKIQYRQDMADVEYKENENTRRQVDWLEKRLSERDAYMRNYAPNKTPGWKKYTVATKSN